MASLEERLQRGVELAGRWAADNHLCKSVTVGDARKVLALLTAARASFDPEPCLYDHHGNCQAHGLGNPCEQKLLRDAVAAMEDDR